MENDFIKEKIEDAGCTYILIFCRANMLAAIYVAFKYK